MFNKKNYIVIIVLFLISCGGARFVEEVPGAEHVNLVASVDQTQCELKGEVKDSVKGYSDSSLNNTETNLIQQILGTFLYYAIAINNNILPALCNISTKQTIATATTTKIVIKLMNYLA